MSVRYGLLALLAETPMYGARLRSEFEARTGGTWPLNVGQVYSTLDRLQRDGLVAQLGDSDEEGRITYALTETGRGEVTAWWHTPVGRTESPRDEMVIKLALAVTAPGVLVRDVIQTQRTATMQRLHALMREKTRHEQAGDLTAILVAEHQIFAREADARWLDHIETRIIRGPAPGLHTTENGRATSPTPGSNR